MASSKFFVLVLLAFVIFIGFSGFDQVHGHKAQIIGDYKLDVGWKNEPPIANEPNAVEIEITIASDFDKQRSDVVSFESDTPASAKDITGLADKLEVYVRIGSTEKYLLALIEDDTIPGLYYGEYTPQESGKTRIEIYGKIQDHDFEATFNPEKVTENPNPVNQPVVIPNWIQMIAKWWSEGAISDSEFVLSVQYLFKNNILNVPITYQESDSSTGNSTHIPSWVKINAGWWADGLISDDDFINGVQYMVTNGIILL